MTYRRACLPHRSHFHGNGTCDAMREANKREDCRDAGAAPYTGMESELAPYSGAGTMMTPYGGAENTMTPYGGAGSAVMPNSGPGSTTAPNGGGAASGHDDPEYGPDHEWTAEEEEGLNTLPQDSFTEPLNADEAARSSWRALLARNVGRTVLVRFLMGTQNFITVEGELYEVGTDYIVIYQPLWDSHITADLYSVKFVEFREPPGVTTLA